MKGLSCCSPGRRWWDRWAGSCALPTPVSRAKSSPLLAEQALLTRSVSCGDQAPWDPSAPKARWQMKWTNPAKAGTKRSATDFEGDAVGAVHPRMPVIYKDDDFMIVHKPWDVRMDGEHDVTVESLALEWLESIGAPAASCHVPGVLEVESWQVSRVLGLLVP